MKKVLAALAIGIALASVAWACGAEAPAATTVSPDGSAPTTDDASSTDAAIAEGPDGAKLDASAPDAAPFCIRSGTGAPDGGADAGDDDCLARLAFGAKRVPYYRSHPLEQANPAIERIVLVQHGNNRNAWDYYDVVAAAAVASDPVHTAVIAPHFQTFNTTCGKDAIGPDDLYWGCSDWKEGSAAKNGLTDSYAVLDGILAAAKAAFPNVKRVTVAGYSAGGQTIQRYAAGNLEHDRTPTIATRYVVGSPGTYLYLDGRRLRQDVPCANVAGCTLAAASFEVPDYAPGCESADPAVEPAGAGYDDYRYGLRNRAGYLAEVPDAQLVAAYTARSVVYVLSEGDSAPGPGTAYSVLDKECPAMVQGPVGASFRMQRGLVYHRYITILFGAAHRLVIVPVCGHDAACVLSSPQMTTELFGP